MSDSVLRKESERLVPILPAQPLPVEALMQARSVRVVPDLFSPNGQNIERVPDTQFSWLHVGALMVRISPRTENDGRGALTRNRHSGRWIIRPATSTDWRRDGPKMLDITSIDY